MLSEKQKAQLDRLHRQGHSLESRAKMSLSRIGRKHSEETKKKISLAHIGMKYSAETIEKLRIVGKNRKFSPETRLKMSMAKKAYKFTETHRKNMGGENSPRWKGGITPISHQLRSCYKYNHWRSSVFIRDNFTCQECGQKSVGNLEAHHKKPFYKLIEEAKNYLPLFSVFEAAMSYSNMWDIDNGVTLCVSCHKKTDSYLKRT